MRKFAVVMIVLAVSASVAFSEMDRTLYTKENRYPRLYMPEVGVLYEYKELQDNNADLKTANFYSRIRPLEDLALRVNVPYSTYSPDKGDDTDGIGDVTIGADLIGYEGLLDYPYVIPYVDHTFDTGDEDENLGRGEDFSTFGIGVGTIVDDRYHWMLDAGYRVFDDSDNALVVGGSFLWELNDQFAAIAETQYEQKPDAPDSEDDYAQFYTAGFAYEASEMLTFGLYGTRGSHNTDQDVIVTVKAALSL